MRIVTHAYTPPGKCFFTSGGGTSMSSGIVMYRSYPPAFALRDIGVVEAVMTCGGVGFPQPCSPYEAVRTSAATSYLLRRIDFLPVSPA